jgi:hypothetical protein
MRPMTTSPQVIPGLNRLSAQATADIESIIRKVYEMGREDMRRELMALLSPASGDAVAVVGEVHVPNIANARTSTKAPPGTVRPAILKMIEGSSGVSTEQILDATGFKENSVRGTLSTLAKEGRIERHLKTWIAKRFEGVAEELVTPSKSSESGSDALLRETADHDR